MLKRITACPTWHSRSRLSRACLAGALGSVCVARRRARATTTTRRSFDTKIIKGIFGINDGGGDRLSRAPAAGRSADAAICRRPEQRRGRSTVRPGRRIPTLSREKRKEAAATKRQRKSFEDGRPAADPGRARPPGRMAAAPAAPARRPRRPTTSVRTRRIAAGRTRIQGRAVRQPVQEHDKDETAMFTGEPPRTNLTAAAGRISDAVAEPSLWLSGQEGSAQAVSTT